MAESGNWEHALVRILRRANYWASKRLGPGTRTLVGILFIIGGILGFLPILGFWMIPVGVILIALEFPRYRRPIRAWLLKKKQALNAKN